MSTRRTAPPGPPGLGDRLLQKVGVVGLMLGSAALAVGDFVTALHEPASLAFTIAETVFVLPWALVVFRLDRHDPSPARGRGWSRTQLVAAHVINVLLLAGCLAEKWLVLLEAGKYGSLYYLSQYRMLTVVAYVLVNIGLLGRRSRITHLVLTLSERPARLTALAFGLTGLFGALLLNLPQSLRRAADASFVDGLFTAISAVCVTGLVVHPTAETYTPFGQAVLLALFQAGGLGIMALSSSFAILAGRRLRLRSTAVLAEMVDAESLSALRRTVIGIVTYTLAIELVGAVLLLVFFQPYPAVALGPGSPEPLAGAGNRVWAAVFHSVSAFCNAGFTVFRGNATAFAGSWPVSLTLMVLIVLGGLGFPVLRELGERFRYRMKRQRSPRMSLHARVVLWTSGILVVGLAALVLALEWDASMAGRPWHERVLTALFQSVTARTAGFNTLSIGALSAPTLLALCAIMFIGASPGSTGGGVKTTTLAVLYATFRAELLGRASPWLLDRSIDRTITHRAMGVFFLSISMVVTMLFVLLITESHAPLDLAFETFSAFATVGLSTGITPELSTTGKLILTVTMFIGRIGPLTLALALAARARPRSFEYPTERVIIG